MVAIERRCPRIATEHFFCDGVDCSQRVQISEKNAACVLRVWLPSRLGNIGIGNIGRSRNHFVSRRAFDWDPLVLGRPMFYLHSVPTVWLELSLYLTLHRAGLRIQSSFYYADAEGP